jgi:hypothetical protein
MIDKRKWEMVVTETKSTKKKRTKVKRKGEKKKYNKRFNFRVDDLHLTSQPLRY